MGGWSNDRFLVHFDHRAEHLHEIKPLEERKMNIIPNGTIHPVSPTILEPVILGEQMK